MPTSLANAISPGNMVVPLAAIIDRLDGKLSAADLNALLLALVSKRSSEVRPGDLITADLINSILSDIADLNRRLLLLEAGRPPAKKQVLIVSPSPTTTLRIGDPLVIRGEGLRADSLVTIQDQPLAGAFGSPDDSTLSFRAIPPLDIPGGLPSSGKNVQLAVSNELGGFSTTFLLKPFALSKPIGSMTITVSGKPAAGTKFKAGGQYVYRFKITADTKPDLSFKVAVGIGAANWTAVPSQSEIFVPAARDAGTPTVAELAVTVTIGSQAQTGDLGKLYVQLTAKDDQTFTWRSTPDEEIKVDASATPVQKLSFTLSKTAAGSAAIRTNPDNTLTALIGLVGGSGGTGELQFNVARTDGALEAGDYQVDLAKLVAFTGDSVPPKWQASIAGAPDGKVNFSGSAQPLRVSVTAKAGAPNAQLQIAMAKANDASVAGDRSFDVEVRS